MPRRSKFLSATVLLGASFLCVCLFAFGAQIAPMPDPRVSVPPPDTQTVPTSPAAPSDSPNPKLLGWSTTGEVGASTPPGSNPVRLPADEQDIVLFFGAPGAHGSPVEFRYRLTG